MANLSDQIERYIMNLIKKYEGKIEIQRNQLASDFDCAPSQINYVLETRFPFQKGYIVESQRGGGGYIRIIRVKIDSKEEYLRKLISRLGRPISQKDAEAIISRFYDNKLINSREKALMKVVMNKRLIGVNLPHRDFIRGNLLRGMVEVILKADREG
ncbi:MAG TPA: CtsR family transcriptional regulator [Halanaerobiales bacterium]|nr:CtsR family transcriptional regulator [Halanaerobiales bacterium]